MDVSILYSPSLKIIVSVGNHVDGSSMIIREAIDFWPRRAFVSFHHSSPNIFFLQKINLFFVFDGVPPFVDISSVLPRVDGKRQNLW